MCNTQNMKFLWKYILIFAKTFFLHLLFSAWWIEAHFLLWGWPYKNSTTSWLFMIIKLNSGQFIHPIPYSTFHVECNALSPSSLAVTEGERPSVALEHGWFLISWPSIFPTWEKSYNEAGTVMCHWGRCEDAELLLGFPGTRGTWEKQSVYGLHGFLEKVSGFPDLPSLKTTVKGT